jgi:Flp pilus assembly protein TadG
MMGKIRSERTSRLGRALLADIEGLAAIEMALILPIAVMLMSLIVYGGQAYTVQRKVTLGATTVAFWRKATTTDRPRSPPPSSPRFSPIRP